MLYQLIAIPVISALIGYITNILAIKLLFWPQKPVNLFFFTLHGLLPKRQEQIAISIGELVEEQLLSLDEIIDHINTPPIQAKIMDNLNTVLGEKIEAVIPRIVPGKVVQLIRNTMEKSLRQEAPGIINQIIESGREHLKQDIQVKKIVADKIRAFDLNQLEEMIRGVSSTELRFIELLGGILGFIIGIIQVGILILFPIH